MPTTTTPSECHHAALRIESGIYRCSACGTTFERKTPAEHIAAMRASLRRPRPKPKPPVEHAKPAPPPIPRKAP